MLVIFSGPCPHQAERKDCHYLIYVLMIIAKQRYAFIPSGWEKQQCLCPLNLLFFVLVGLFYLVLGLSVGLNRRVVRHGGCFRWRVRLSVQGCDGRRLCRRQVQPPFSVHPRRVPPRLQAHDRSRIRVPEC